MGSPIFDSTFATGRFRYEEPMTTDPTTSPSSEPQDVRDTFMQVLASLVAAVSLLKSGGKAAKKAAPSDKMFDQMILDYERAIEQGRAALAQSDAEPIAKLQRQLKEREQMRAEANEIAKAYYGNWQNAETRIAELQKRIAEPDASAGLIEAAECRDLLRASSANYWEKIEREIGEGFRSAILTNHQAAHLLAWAKIARDAALLSRAADRGVHSELIPDCPTDGVAARQGNGG